MSATKKTKKYSASDIEVLEGLEPVRRRPGMYIGGTDQSALHHMFCEILDNSMDEAVAGYATRIEIDVWNDGKISIADNGRGIPVDPHPKFPNKSALEVIMTTLHSGGKFNTNVYSTSGGLHGVGVSVVNALSKEFIVEVKRSGTVYQQSYSCGTPVSDIKALKPKDVSSAKDSWVIKNKSGTKISFSPDAEIFGDSKIDLAKLYGIANSKAYLYKGVTIVWRYHDIHPSSEPEDVNSEDKTVAKEDVSFVDSFNVSRETSEEGQKIPKAQPVPKFKAFDEIHYSNGIKDYVSNLIPQSERIMDDIMYIEAELENPKGKIECAFIFSTSRENKQRYYCNTIYNPLGGAHEQGFRATILKALRSCANFLNYKGFDKVSADDIMEDVTIVLSIFISHPSFQGQTKEKLLSREAAKLVELALKDRIEQALISNPKTSRLILDQAFENASDRIRRKAAREVQRKNPLQRLRLPGKLTDCTGKSTEETEILIVEGESAGGTTKQARDRNTQAVLPLRGKFLNVLSNSAAKVEGNQEVSDLVIALGCGMGKNFDIEKLRYGKVIIMTDADVDGAHICTLILTFFYAKMPQLLKEGRVYLVKPPLYRISYGKEHHYVDSDSEKDDLLAKLKKSGKVEVSRFKGLGEMTAKQLKETTMSVGNRTLYRVELKQGDLEEESSQELVSTLMGKKPELRFKFIRENATFT